MFRKAAVVAFVASIILSGVLDEIMPARAADNLTNVTFSLDFIVLGRDAPFFVALDKGFYKDEGLNVSIVPSKGTAQAIQNVQSGIAQLGFIDVPSLVVARAGGSTVQVVSVIYQKAPFCFFSLDSGAHVTKLKDFVGLTVGSSSGSYISKIARAMMRKASLDPNTLKVENIEPSARIAMLATGQIPAIDFYIISKPAVERAVKNAKVDTFLFADHGLALYSNGIGATEAYLKAHPDVVKGFVRATLRGYAYAFAHPEEAAEIIKKHYPALDNNITVEELSIVRSLAVTSDVEKHGLGTFDAAEMTSSVEWMDENGGFPKDKAPKPEDIYATGFLPNPPIMP